MAKPSWETLLIAAALVSGTATAQEAQDTATEGEAADGIDIEVPGITVTGTSDRNVQRATHEVISVLSADDIARTGEGDIAGALGRITGEVTADALLGEIFSSFCIGK